MFYFDELFFKIMSKIFSIKTIIIIFSCIGSLFVIMSTSNYKTGLSPDSVEYLAAANNLILGKGLLTYNGLPFTEWPPLYPILLSLLSFLLNIKTILSAVIINSILFGLIIYQTGIILLKYINFKSLIVLGQIGVLFSIPVFSEALWAHSELLFTLILILYIDFLISFLEKDKLSSFIVIVILSALAMLTRYVGITFVFVSCFAIMFFVTGNLKKKNILLFTYSALSILPVSIWLIRNYMEAKTFFGERGASHFSFLENIYSTINGILSWEIAKQFISLKIFFIVLCLIAAGFFSAVMFKKIRIKNLYLKLDKRITIILCLIIIVYLLFLIIISSIKAHNAIDNRLLSPIYIPGMVLILIVLSAIYRRIELLKNFKLFKIIFLSLFVIGSIEPVWYNIALMNNHYKYGSGYSGSLWQKKSKEEWLRETEQKFIKDSAIYSNEPFEVYYLTNTYAKWSPRKTYYDSDEIYIRLNNLNGVWPDEKKAFLVWFNQIEFHSTSLYSIQDLQKVSELQIVDKSDVGILYSITVKK